MSGTDYHKAIRDYLVGSSDITDEISSSDIGVSWKRKKVNIPCIAIHQIDNKEVAQMGAGWSSGKPVFRIDVAMRDSAYKTNQIMGYIKDLLLPEGYEIMTEFDSYDDKYEAYIKTINVRVTNTYSF